MLNFPLPNNRYFCVTVAAATLLFSQAQAQPSSSPGPQPANVVFEVNKSDVAEMAASDLALATFAASLVTNGNAQAFTGKGGASLYLPANADMLVNELDRYMATSSFSRYAPTVAKIEYRSAYSVGNPSIEMDVRVGTYESKNNAARVNSSKAYRLQLNRVGPGERYRLTSWATAQ